MTPGKSQLEITGPTTRDPMISWPAASCQSSDQFIVGNQYQSQWCNDEAGILKGLSLPAMPVYTLLS